MRSVTSVRIEQDPYGHWTLQDLAENGFVVAEGREQHRMFARAICREHGIQIRTARAFPHGGKPEVFPFLIVRFNWDPTWEAEEQFQRETGYHFCKKRRETHEMPLVYLHSEWGFCPFCGTVKKEPAWR